MSGLLWCGLNLSLLANVWVGQSISVRKGGQLPIASMKSYPDTKFHVYWSNTRLKRRRRRTWTKWKKYSCNFGQQFLLHSLVSTCKIIKSHNNLKLNVRTEFSTYMGRTQIPWQSLYYIGYYRTRWYRMAHLYTTFIIHRILHYINNSMHDSPLGDYIYRLVAF